MIETPLDFQGEPAADATEGGLSRRFRRPLSRRVLLLGGAAVAGVCLFGALCLVIAFNFPSDSDGAVFALAGWDMLHHNVLLHHWDMADAPFNTLEVPLYAVVEFFGGIGPATARIVSVLTYVIVVAVAIALANVGVSGGRAWRRSVLVIALLSVPLCFGGYAFILLEMPNHVGTSAYVMIAFLLYARWPGHRATPWVLCAVLVAGQTGDATVRYIGVTTVILVAVIRAVVARSVRTPDVRIGVAALLSIPAALLLRAAMVHAGAYTQVPVKTHLAPLSAWPGNFKGTMTSLLFVYNIYQVHLKGHHSAGMYIAAVVGAIGLLAGIYGFGRTASRLFRASAVDQLACIAVVVYLGPYTVSSMGNSSYTFGYEFIGVIPMFAVLLARNPPPVKIARPVVVTSAVATGAVAILVSGALQPTVTSSQQLLAVWLNDHGYTHGVGSYWDAASVTVDSGNAVQVRSVTRASGGYSIYAWHADSRWYNPGKADADFFIADPLYAGFSEADVEKIYGAPSETFTVAGEVIMVYPFNLLEHVDGKPVSQSQGRTPGT